MFSVMKLTNNQGGQEEGAKIWPVGDNIRGPAALQKSKKK